MYIILGATGHIGSTVAEILLEQGENVTIITRDQDKADDWTKKGAQAAVVDVRDLQALHTIFKTGKRLYLLNPPALPNTDMVAEERQNMQSIIAALKGSGIEKIVAQSTYGAQDKDGIGDLGVLYEMEQALKPLNIPTTIIRGAYYMSNWDGCLESAKNKNRIYTLYPADFKLAMVAPKDIGKLAAKLLTEPVDHTGLYHMEGPEKYSPTDVADAFSEILQQEVKVSVTPRSEWVPVLKSMGFSQEGADSMAAMTATTLDEAYPVGEPLVRGETTIREYLQDLIAASA